MNYLPWYVRILLNSSKVHAIIADVDKRNCDYELLDGFILPVISNVSPASISSI